jgi:hypothetical protein
MKQITIDYVEDTALIEVVRPNKSYTDVLGRVWQDEDEYINAMVDAERDEDEPDYGDGEYNDQD